jgi:molybdopterin synthase sulfur carrier subunit
MKVAVKYFASIREAIGQGGEAIETSAATCAALRDELVARGGAYAQALAHGKSVRIALDQVMVEGGAELREGGEVAFFPPVTGG